MAYSIMSVTRTVSNQTEVAGGCLPLLLLLPVWVWATIFGEKQTLHGPLQFRTLIERTRNSVHPLVLRPSSLSVRSVLTKTDRRHRIATCNCENVLSRESRGSLCE